jgi:hypothetical protein
MNSHHVINGWIAQLSLDARRGAGRSSTAVEPVSPSLGDPPAVEAVSPARTRGRLLPVRAWGRDGWSRRAVGGPCLSLG